MPIRHEPVALMLSRQPLPTLDRARYASAVGVARGAYVLADPPSGEPEVILIATGREVAMTGEAYEQLHRQRHPGADGVHAVDGTVRQTAPLLHHHEVLPPSVHSPVSVEKGSTLRLGPLGGSDQRDHRDRARSARRRR